MSWFSRLRPFDKLLLWFAVLLGALPVLLKWLLLTWPISNQPSRNDEGLWPSALYLGRVVFGAVGIPVLYLAWYAGLIAFVGLLLVRVVLFVKAWLRAKDEALNQPRQR